MILYFDTSALVKLVILEEGSRLAAELWTGADPVAASILAYPEGRAALAAAHRGDRLRAREHARALADFEDLHRELLLVGVDETLARHAGALADDLGLRGYDAVHLATALDLDDDDVAMITWDAELGRGAERVGLAVGGG